MGTSIGLRKILKAILQFQPKVTVNQSITNHGLLGNVQNWLIEGSRLNYSD
jgi:hypothetical protein